MDICHIMSIPRAHLGRGTAVKVRVLSDAEASARAMAEEMAQVIRENNRAGRPTCVIVPVGPVGQYAFLARLIAAESLDCARVTFINMDEFLGDDGDWISAQHPLSFRGFMERAFYGELPARAGFRIENRVFPDPRAPERIGEIIAERGGVDVCFGGIGLNGHIAFNEPELETVVCSECGGPVVLTQAPGGSFWVCQKYPKCGGTVPLPAELGDGRGDSSGAGVSVREFAERPTRVLRLAPESRAHMAVNLSCALDHIPWHAITVGMKEILGAGRLSLFASRHWQRGVVRQALHGPVTPWFPASYIQQHPNASLTITEFVAEAPEVRLQ